MKPLHIQSLFKITDPLQLTPSFYRYDRRWNSIYSGSVIVNNTVLPAADPNIGFSIPNIASGQMATITFQVSLRIYLM